MEGQKKKMDVMKSDMKRASLSKDYAEDWDKWKIRTSMVNHIQSVETANEKNLKINLFKLRIST